MSKIAYCQGVAKIWERKVIQELIWAGSTNQTFEVCAYKQLWQTQAVCDVRKLQCFKYYWWSSSMQNKGKCRWYHNKLKFMQVYVRITCLVLISLTFLITYESTCFAQTIHVKTQFNSSMVALVMFWFRKIMLRSTCECTFWWFGGEILGATSIF